MNESQNALGRKDPKDHIIPNPFQRERQLPTRLFKISHSCQPPALSGLSGSSSTFGWRAVLDFSCRSAAHPMANPPQWCIHTTRFGPVLRWTECNKTEQNEPYIPLPKNVLTNKVLLVKILNFIFKEVSYMWANSLQFLNPFAKNWEKQNKAKQPKNYL